MSDIEITIQGLGSHGEGVGRDEGYPLFVEGALPEERVRVRLIEKRKTYGKAKLLQVLIPSIHRVDPPCPVFGICGGCQLMHLSYSEQLVVKRQRVVDALARIAKITTVPVEPCLGSPDPLHYRNKIQLPVRTESGRLVLGLYGRGSHDLVEIEQCFIHGVLGEKVFAEVKKSLQELDTESLRHLLIKTSWDAQHALVVLVTAAPPTDALKAWAQHLLETDCAVKGVIHNQHGGGPDNVILGKQYTLLAGEATIEEKLCGLSFQISAASFFQVNPRQAERLYETAIACAELREQDRVLDAYCGVGTLSLVIATRVAHVTGIEIVPEAIEDAVFNAQRNQISNVTFRAMPMETWMQTSSTYDVIFLNPPRKGCEASVLKAAVQASPRALVYISCDPATLARDLALLSTYGYTPERVFPIDMFPQTAHVECVVRLSRSSFL